MKATMAAVTAQNQVADTAPVGIAQHITKPNETNAEKKGKARPPKNFL